MSLPGGHAVADEVADSLGRFRYRYPLDWVFGKTAHVVDAFDRHDAIKYALCVLRFPGNRATLEKLVGHFRRRRGFSDHLVFPAFAAITLPSC
jgi:hypothetical protein